MISRTPHTDPLGDQFDFWLGEWELEWPSEQMSGTPGELGTGTNRIRRILNGHVIEESFSTSDGSFRGHSVSVPDPTERVWRQTWVDSSGGYIALTGGLERDRMVLQTEPLERNGELVVNRMVFRDMTEESLRWDWQGSRDGGQTWIDIWNIEYRRRV